MRKSYVLLFSFLFFFITSLIAEESIIIAGAGPSTWLVSSFYNFFRKEINEMGYTFIIPIDSIKHKGGVDSCEKNLFGRTGRNLNDEEKALGKEEIILASIPAVIGVGSMINIDTLTLDNIKDIFTGKIRYWNQLGGPDHEIFVLGRENTEALFIAMKKDYPFFENCKFNDIVTKDNYVIDFLSSEKGNYAIAFGSKLNFFKTKIKILNVPNFHTETNLGLVYSISNKSHPLVSKIKTLANSPKWYELVESAGYSPPVTVAHNHSC